MLWTLIKREFWENKRLISAPFFFIVLWALLIIKPLSSYDAGFINQFKNYALFTIIIPTNLLFLVTIDYCLGSLFNDRKDLSIYFWKSLPISDFLIVLSKLITAIISVCIAVISAIIILKVSSLIFIIIAVMRGDFPLLKEIFYNFNYVQSVLFIGKFLLLEITGLFPFIGWCFFISAISPRSPFWIAFLVPVISGLIITELGQFNWISWCFKFLFGWTTDLLNLYTAYLHYNDNSQAQLLKTDTNFLSYLILGSGLVFLSFIIRRFRGIRRLV